MKTKFLTLERARKLEETIGFLTHYTPIEGEVHVIGTTLEETDERFTQLLTRLGELNVEREKILKKFME